MMNDNHNDNQTSPADNRKQNTSSSDRYATCSMIAGITGLICSFFYLPASLISSSNTPTGLICGVIGILLAIMSKNADVKAKKSFSARAIAGIVLSVIAISVTFFFFYALACYYEALSDPVMGPQLNEFINRFQEQINQQMHLPAASGWIYL